MANENQINKNSPEYRTGYDLGLGKGLFVGGVISVLGIGGALWTHNLLEESKKADLEKKLSSSETFKAVKELKQSEQELYTAIDRMSYDSHPDKATTDVIVECRKPYAAVLKDCISQNHEEKMKCIYNALKRTPKEQKKFDACVDKYEDKVMGIDACGVIFPYPTNDTFYDKCDAISNEKVKACSKTSYDTFNQCREKALEQGFQRYQEQKNPQKRN